MKRLVTVAALLLGLGVLVPAGTASAASPVVQLPADSGAIFLGNAPYNVKCDGVTDNTAAIQNALNTYGNHNSAVRFSPHTLVLPAGTCMVSGSLIAPGSALRLMGAGQGNTVLKLKNNATGFGSAGTPKYLYETGMETGTNANVAYGNYVQDMTFDVGAGNPGAVGLRFNGCNSAAVQQVTIQAPAGSGLRGLTFETAPGPLQVRDLTVTGFDVGIYATSGAINNLVFSNTRLSNQRTVGIQNLGKNFQFEGLTVSGDPKVYTGTGPASAIFFDANLTGPGSGTAVNTATGGFVYARNVTASGWGNLITYGSTAHFAGRTSISEWGSAGYQKGNTKVPWSETGPVVSLNLPHPAAPLSTDYNLADWRKAAATSNNANDDDGPAIQAAIDSGAKVVYLPYGNYTVKSTVVVRGNVEAIDFMGSTVQGTGKISVGNSTSPFVQLRNVANSLTLEQNGPDAMVLTDLGAVGTAPGDITTGASATGDVFVDENGGQTYSITRPVRFFVRDADREGRTGNVSGGATAWLLGDNVEAHDGHTPFFTVTGSTLEVAGGAWDNLATGGAFNSTTGTAAYTATNSRMSVLEPGVYLSGAVTGHWVSDTVNGVRVGNVTDADVFHGNATGSYKRVALPLYVSP